MLHCIYMQNMHIFMCVYIYYIFTYVYIYFAYICKEILKDIDMLRGLFLGGGTLNTFFSFLPSHLWSYFYTVSMFCLCSSFKRGKGSRTHPGSLAQGKDAEYCSAPCCILPDTVRAGAGSPAGADWLPSGYWTALGAVFCLQAWMLYETKRPAD